MDSAQAHGEPAVVLVIRGRLREGEAPLVELARSLVRRVVTEEPGTLRYVWSLDETRTAVQVEEAYATAGDFLAHMAALKRRGELRALADVLAVEAVDAWADAPEVRAALSALPVTFWQRLPVGLHARAREPSGPAANED